MEIVFFQLLVPDNLYNSSFPLTQRERERERKRERESERAREGEEDMGK